MKKLLLGWVLLLGSLPAMAEIVTEAVTYHDEDVTLTGHLYYQDTKELGRPGVIVVHEWWGLNEYAKKRARMLAELGYVAFAIDMYGDGRVTDQPAQAREWMQEVTADVEGWRARASLGLAQLRSNPLVDPDKIAAVGYCFGGATVFQMAYDNAPLKAVVSFHGALPAAPEESKGKIGPAVLIQHGQADSFVAPEVVSNFRAKLDEAGALWEMNTYGGARHGFTNPDAGDYGIPNLKYDARADKASWARMQSWFDEFLK